MKLVHISDKMEVYLHTRSRDSSRVTFLHDKSDGKTTRVKINLIFEPVNENLIYYDFRKSL